MFRDADFELFEPRFQGDEEWNGRRLELRRRLQAFGERLRAAFRAEGVSLDRRESLHHPHASNRKRVRRQRTMLFRDRKARSALQRFLGRELGRDLDSARNNLHFQAGLDARQAFWGLRLDAGAWYDLNVLLKRAEEEEGRRALVEAGRAAPGFLLEVDGGGPRPLESLDSRAWRDLAGVLRPGESSLDLIQRLPRAEATAAGEDLAEGILSDLLRLLPFYRLACWDLDSPAGASL